MFRNTAITPDQLPDDVNTLKAMIIAQGAETARLEASLKAGSAAIEALKLRMARLRKQKFGRSSEKIEPEIEQLEFALEAPEVKQAADDTDAEGDNDRPPETVTAGKSIPCRRGKPRIADDAPREQVVPDPGETCPDCGGPLRMLSEDVSGIPGFVAAERSVIETHRPGKSCRQCGKITQVPAPARPVTRGMAAPALLAHGPVAKFDDHLPLYRQGEIFARRCARHSGPISRARH